MDAYHPAARARRESWHRRHRHTLRYAREASRPPLGFEEILAGLTRGRMDPRVAGDLLRGGKDPEITIRIDRSTGLVSHWSVKLPLGDRSKPTTTTPAAAAPAA